METENRSIIAKGRGERGWEVLFNGHRVSVLQDEKSSETDSSELRSNMNALKISLERWLHEKPMLYASYNF